MNFKPTRTFAYEKLNNFIEKNLIYYSKARNFDYGPDNRANVSCLSPYISHGIIREIEVINKSLKKYSFIKNEKFIQEILWRVYWKGWLELRPNVWLDYLNDLKELKENFKNNQNYLNVIEGKTNIDCFNYWVNELKENNYLHNHTRMWFASIWIFTLKLPWQLGAEFFMQHLYDGDTASNTLSWRWVAGIHTNKKPYIASKENINKYTKNRFKDFQINISKQINTIKTNQHQSNKIPTHINLPKNDILLMFENDLNIANRSKLFNSYSKIYILFNELRENKLRLSQNVTNFKKHLIENVNKLIPNSEIINSNDIYIILDDLICIDLIYPGVGSNLDFINKYAMRKQININYIYREEDLNHWKNATSGFYKFKTSFYSTISH